MVTMRQRSGADQRVVHSADVDCDRAAIRHGPMVATSSVGSFPWDSPVSRNGRTDGDGAVNGARSKSVTAQSLTSEAQKLRDAGGRIRFAYAWSPNSDDVELRYLVAVPNQREFDMWTLKAAHDVPSIARIWPALGWYEREMMDLNGVRFIDHPEPYPLVLRHGDFTHINGHDPAPSRRRSHLPRIDAKEVQQLPFGPIRADVLESAEFTFFYVGEHIIHYQPNLFFKHRGMEKRASKDVPPIKRSLSPNASLG